MSKATIQIAYVNQPKSDRGPGSVKTNDGTFYKVWRSTKIPGGATLDQFAAGKTYEIEYDTEQYNGKESRTARKILSSSNGSNGDSDDVARADARAYSEDRSARIERQAALKVAVQMLGDNRGLGELFALAESIEEFIDQAGKTEAKSETTAPVEQEVQL